MDNEYEDSLWGSRKFYLIILISQIGGYSLSSTIPASALYFGTLGFMVFYILFYVIMGIPLLYMELIIGQFTGRYIVQLWKVRGCLSHIGYIVIVWQIIILIHNHVTVAFNLHYFLISFETPVPYYTCGKWSTSSCDILVYNYTVNQDCMKAVNPPDYCHYVFTTFPEFQYFRAHLLGTGQSSFVIWHVALPSALASIIVYLCCFKRRQSLKWFIGILTLYPMIGFLILLMGSMVQKGIVIKFSEAMDADWSTFMEKFRLSQVIQQAVHSLGLGTGIVINLGASSSFRAPSYSNAVIAIVIEATFCALSVCVNAMIFCPYAFRYSISPKTLMAAPTSLAFEKIPRMLYEYKNKMFWLILIYSCNAVLGIRTTVVFIFNLLETSSLHHSTVARYPGLVCFALVLGLFFGSLPFLNAFGINSLSGAYRRYLQLISMCTVLLECLVFILWYGLDRFCEDVHFMQGIQPKIFLKLGWSISTILLVYVFIFEIYYQYNVLTKFTISDIIGWSILGLFIVFIFGLMLIKVLVGVCRNRLQDVVSLNSDWKPRNEVLQRSRAMFSAQAMTKEYLYRQYHLKAGIVERQKRSNVRALPERVQSEP